MVEQTIKQLSIREANVPAHLDIEREIKGRKNGQVTFTLRINAGNIMDLVVVEYVDARQYLKLKSITVSELTVAHNSGERGSQDAIRSDDS